jgi:hypothetical protein
MMIRLTLILTLLPGMALAHLGHLGDLAGHDHWVAGAAIGVAVVVGVWGAVKGRKDKEPAPQEAAEDEAEA